MSPHSRERHPERGANTLGSGLDNAGKTTIVKRIMGEDVNTVSPTLGFIIKTIDYEGYKLNIWDVGGQKTLRSYWRNYFEKTDALIWVVDATDRLRIEDCRTELHGLLQEEVRRLSPTVKKRSHTDSRGAEIIWSNSPGVRQQDRRSGVHDGRGDGGGPEAEEHPDSPVEDIAV